MEMFPFSGTGSYDLPKHSSIQLSNTTDLNLCPAWTAPSRAKSQETLKCHHQQTKSVPFFHTEEEQGRGALAWLQSNELQ